MRPETYRHLIAELTKTVTEAGGSMKRHDAEIQTAKRLGISLASFQGVAITAHADRSLVLTLRSDTLSLPEA